MPIFIDYCAEILECLLYPRVCVACSRPLFKQEDHICLICCASLPFTAYHKHTDHDLERRFWGRVVLRHAWAMLQYTKKGKVQKIVHAVKYKGNQELGVLMGKWYGQELKGIATFDLIVPVPLHAAKWKSRGYNQSACFAQGLSEVLGVPWEEVLQKNTKTGTQTQRNRFARWLNVSEGISVRSQVNGMRILLVDDVITTGATLEACARVLLDAGCQEVSVCAMASAAV